MRRTKAYYRNERNKAIQRKYEIRRFQWGKECADREFSIYHHLGELSKGKVHCSCRCCGQKTRYWGWKTCDKRKLISMDEKLKEFQYADYNMEV